MPAGLRLASSHFERPTMTSRLERKWWFAAPISALAVVATMYLMANAGIAHPDSVSRWALYALCFAGLQRGLSFVAWLLVLLLSPSHKALERAR